ncbi:hypothetical protein Acr_28g0001600 [Actinidia rufa]|uniref:Uncharacterized protein n=1 Tax=Actinidia rufa TaxID=165716 RepID=A0A7J0H912_9ERIC|nr:hypothetical protein Acr_28g0001600 [Actinidia rufa]
MVVCFGGSAMVQVRAQRNLIERGLELVGCENKTGRDEETSKKRPEKRSQEEVKRRGQRRGLKKEVIEVRKRGREEVKEEIPADDGGGQNSERQRGVLYTCSMRETCTDGKQHDKELLAKEQSGSAWQTGDPLRGRKTRGLYRLEGSVQTEGAAVRHGSSGISKKNGQRKQLLHGGTQSKLKSTRKDVLEGSRVVQKRKEKLWDTCESLAKQERCN